MSIEKRVIDMLVNSIMADADPAGKDYVAVLDINKSGLEELLPKEVMSSFEGIVLNAYKSGFVDGAKKAVGDMATIQKTLAGEE